MAGFRRLTGLDAGTRLCRTHPERVSELVLRGIYTVTGPELDWYYQFGVSEMYPDRWENFIAPIPEAERGEMMQAYNRYLTGTDEAKKLECARAWSQWEGATIALCYRSGARRGFRRG